MQDIYNIAPIGMPRSRVPSGTTAEMVAREFENLTEAAALERAETEASELTHEALERRITQHTKLIAGIRDNAKNGGGLTTRDSRRLDEAEESLAIFSAEDERRRKPMPRRTQPNGRQDIQAPEDEPHTNSVPVRRSQGAEADPYAGARRMGLLLNSSISSPSQIVFARSERERADGRAWRNPDEFFNVLANGLADPRLISAATNVEGVGTDGGFIVPASWYFGLVDGTLQEAELARRCRLFGTPTNNLSVPMLNTSDRSVSIAGIAANWVAENTQGTAQKLRFRMVSAKLHKVMILAEASSELLEDAGGAGYAVQLESAMKTATAYTLDEAILDGTGVGQPLGIHRAASTIEVAPESGQVADTLRFQNLVDMWARLHPSCQKRAIWFFSPDLLPALLTMTFPGSTSPVLLSGGFNDAATGAPGQTIFGRPCVISEIAPPAGDRGDITLVDMSQYALLMKNSARIAYDGAPGFDRDVATWRLTMRADGVPQWSTVISPRNGGSTLSWCVVLGAR